MSGHPTSSLIAASRVHPGDKVATQALLGASSKSGFNYYINGFRGFCVLLVFAYHVVHAGLIPVPDPGQVINPIQNIMLFFSSSWRFGVELFFMISGFVIINSLRRHSTISAFLVDRCIRIFPVWIPVHLSIFILGVALGWKYFANTTLADKFSVFVANLLLLPPLIPIPVLHPASWSLSYEWLFYLSAAATCALLIARRNTPLRLAFSLLLAFAVTNLLILIPRALFFIPGVITALNWERIKDARFLKLPVLNSPVISLLLFLIAWRMVDLDAAQPTTTAIAQVLSWSGIAWTLLALVAGLHLFLCVCMGTGLAHRLKHAAMQELGNISYSFYLWHPIVMFAVKKPITSWLLPHAGWLAATIAFTLSSFVLAFLISKASYQLIEKKLSRRLQEWIATHNSRRAASSPQIAIIAGHEGRL